MNVSGVQQVKLPLTKMRIIHGAFILAVAMFVWISQSVCSYGRNDWTLWHWVLAGMALWAMFGGFQIRGRMMRRFYEALAKDASSPKASEKWQAAQLIGMSSGEAVVLYGTIVRMALGGTVRQALPFYAAGLLLLLFWTPRVPALIQN